MDLASLALPHSPFPEGKVGNGPNGGEGWRAGSWRPFAPTQPSRTLPVRSAERRASDGSTRRLRREPGAGLDRYVRRRRAGGRLGNATDASPFVRRPSPAWRFPGWAAPRRRLAPEGVEDLLQRGDEGLGGGGVGGAQLGSKLVLGGAQLIGSGEKIGLAQRRLGVQER